MKRFLTTPAASASSSSSSSSTTPPTKKRWLKDNSSSSAAAAAASITTTTTTTTNPPPLHQTHPLSFITWNANGLLPRLEKSQDWAAFQRMVQEYKPDYLAIQEARLPCSRGGSLGRRGRMYDGGSDKKACAEYRLVYSTIMRMGYKVCLSLADTKKAGTIVMVKEALAGHVKSIAFNLEGRPGEHEDEGRVILLEFEYFSVLNTYVPNHGYSPDSHARRARWDEKMRTFLQTHIKTTTTTTHTHTHTHTQKKPLIWLGDMNVSYLEHDVSHPDFFRKQRGKGVPEPAPEYRGQPGYAPIERRRFSELLSLGGLVDTYRLLRPGRGDNDWSWRGRGPAGAKYWSKGMRIDGVFVSQLLLTEESGGVNVGGGRGGGGDGGGGGGEGGNGGVKFRVVRAENLGKGVQMEGFLGSDHCPVLCMLEPVVGEVGEEGKEKGSGEEDRKEAGGGGTAAKATTATTETTTTTTAIAAAAAAATEVVDLSEE